MSTLETYSEVPILAFSPEQAAKATGLSVVTIYRLLRRNKLRSVAGIRHKVIPRAELERFLRDGVKGEA